MVKKSAQTQKQQYILWGVIAVLAIAVLGLALWRAGSSEPGTDEDVVCAQVITPARDPSSGDCREFPTPCDVPAGWERVSTCAPEPPAPEPEPEPEQEVVAQEPNPEVVKLLGRFDQVKSYSFIGAKLQEKAGAVETVNYGTYKVLGDNARLAPPSIIGMGGWSADFVFLDYSAEHAAAYCLELTPCRNSNLKEGVEFSTYFFPQPESWIEALKPGEIVSERSYNDRRVKVVRWQDEQGYWEAYVDMYYGYPMRVVRASDAERSKVVLGYEYRSMSFNTVKQEEVTPTY